MKGRIEGSEKGKMERWMTGGGGGVSIERSKQERMERRIEQRMDRRIKGWMFGWIDGRMERGWKFR